MDSRWLFTMEVSNIDFELHLSNLNINLFEYFVSIKFFNSENVKGVHGFAHFLKPVSTEDLKRIIGEDCVFQKAYLSDKQYEKFFKAEEKLYEFGSPKNVSFIKRVSTISNVKIFKFEKRVF
ncbi:MAG: hypothetical protein [Agile wallaby adenovirus 1]|nr:MAG: hypothetical protein [Agile wallaby atadenovirus 1]